MVVPIAKQNLLFHNILINNLTQRMSTVTFKRIFKKSFDEFVYTNTIYSKVKLS